MVSVATRKQAARYKYDALGRRIERNLGSGRERTKFTYENHDVLLDDNGGTLTKYLNGIGIDNKLRIQTGADVKYFLADHLGSTNGLADSTGALTASIAYDSFGNPTGNLATSYKFTGREYDSFSGFYYYRARFYDPKPGRFVSEDPIGLLGGDLNLYGYVHNNVVNRTDPFGLIDPIVYQNPGIYPHAGNEVRCLVGDPWLGGELGGNLHILYTGLGGSAGFDFNPITGEICLYAKGSGRLGLGAYIGAGAKFNAGLGPQVQGSGVVDNNELGLDVAFKGGGKATLRGGQFVKSPPWKVNASGSVNQQGAGIGIGPSVGFGASVGVDIGKKKLWCFNTPTKSPCQCK